MIKRLSAVSIVARPDKEVEFMATSVGFQKRVHDKLFFSAQSSSGRWVLAMGRLESGSLTDPEPLEFADHSEFAEGLTPNVMELGGHDGLEKGFLLLFAGRRGRSENRRLFVARAPTLEAPWELTGQTYTPTRVWEGRNIDLGPGSYSADGIGHFFYSSAYPRLQTIAGALLRSPRIPTRSNLMRFERRRIGILRMDLRSMKISSTSEHPLPFVTARGTPFESVFCPGYLKLSGDGGGKDGGGAAHAVFVTGSNYSKGFPFEQGLGVVVTGIAPHEWREPEVIERVLTAADLPAPLSSQTAFDTPDPIEIQGDGRGTKKALIELYFSAMSRTDERWHILRCTLEYSAERSTEASRDNG